MVLGHFVSLLAVCSRPLVNNEKDSENPRNGANERNNAECEGSSIEFFRFLNEPVVKLCLGFKSKAHGNNSRRKEEQTSKGANPTVVLDASWLIRIVLLTTTHCIHGAATRNSRRGSFDRCRARVERIGRPHLRIFAVGELGYFRRRRSDGFVVGFASALAAAHSCITAKVNTGFANALIEYSVIRVATTASSTASNSTDSIIVAAMIKQIAIGQYEASRRMATCLDRKSVV